MTLQNTNISHLGKRKVIDSKVPAGRGHRTVLMEGFEGNHYQSPWQNLHEWPAKLGTVPCFHSVDKLLFHRCQTFQKPII